MPREVKRAHVGGKISLTPAGFKFIGNTLITESELQAVVAPLIGKQIDFEALADAAASLRQLYAARGYVLTDVYLPEQQFSATGGVVEFAVVEARIGKVSVNVAEGSGISQSFAAALARTYLVPGALISQYMLDKPVLLLRDMPGTDAEATVLPGAAVGEADIEIAVVPRAPRFEPFVAADNYGLSTEGEYRFSAGFSVNAPFGIGDVFALRLQATNESGNFLGRVSYGAAVGSYGTKLLAAYSQTEYQLGQELAALGLTGSAGIASLSAVQPFVRGRFTNMFGTLNFEYKTLKNEAESTGASVTNHVSLLRFGLLGNHSDRNWGGGTTSYSLSIAPGDARLDPNEQELDSSPFGPHAAGNFYKINLELQRVQYLSAQSSILLTLNGQYASKNLLDAEKFYLGGPQGVLGYPVGAGVGDQGFTFAIEYRYLTGLRIADEGLSLTAFYNYGKVQFDKVRNSSTLQASVGQPNTLALDSAGVGLLLGRDGNYVVTAALASRLGGPPPPGATSNPSTQFWFQLQKWF